MENEMRAKFEEWWEGLGQVPININISVPPLVDDEDDEFNVDGPFPPVATFNWGKEVFEKCWQAATAESEKNARIYTDNSKAAAELAVKLRDAEKRIAELEETLEAILKIHGEPDTACYDYPMMRVENIIKQALASRDDPQSRTDQSVYQSEQAKGE